MNMRLRALLLVGVLCVCMLVGCGEEPMDSSIPAVSSTTITTTATTTQPADTTADATTSATAESTETTTRTVTMTAATSTTSATKLPTTTTTTAPTTTAADPNRVTVNGKTYAVGDTLYYTVMVKTAENYGTVKVGIRCIQKGLEIPDGTFQKQNQYVMKNMGIGRLGTMPEETIGKNGFIMTANKGYALDATTAGYAGLLWHYETGNYDYAAQTYREIDCTQGIALFTIALKITKAGEYRIDCAEYPNKSRTDLTVWGVIENGI